MYDKARAGAKHWLVFPEYQFVPTDYPDGAFAGVSRDEASYITEFWNLSMEDIAGKTLGIDITGFVRPYLVFLLKWLAVRGVRQFDALYTEPVIYSR